jgi:quercetin dioxygenase-like cupin family protein
VGEAFRILRLEEREALSVWDGTLRTPVQERLGLGAFGANVYSALEPGQRVIEEHDHVGSGEHQELYVVLAGRAAFVISEEQLEAPAGTLVFVRPEARRAAIALEAGTTVLAIGAPVGAPYRAPPWPAEAGMWRYRALFEAGDYRGAAAFLEGVLARFPGNAGILTELARCRRELEG